MALTVLKTCKKHNVERTIGCYPKKEGGVRYKSWCRICKREKLTTYRALNAEHVRRTDKARLKRLRTGDVAWAILQDSKRSDKLRDRANDLDKEFIRQKVTQPCRYCGETNLRMTLDRIDNSLGHTKENAVPACIRCNYLRKDMPYEAWTALCPALKRIRKQGLFKNWTGRAR